MAKTILPYIISGISVGGQYALIAIGYTMVYGILRLINFAHGDVFMVAGLMMVYMAAAMPLYIAIPLMIILTVFLGFMIERVAYRPLRTAPRMSVMISAIGVSYLIQNLALYITGGLNKNYPSIPWISDRVTVFGMETSRVTIITPFLTIILVVLLVQLINHTKIGMAMRAVSLNFETSQLMGVFHELSRCCADLRRNARPEGFCRSGVWRDRLDSRRCDWRVHHRHCGEPDQGPRHDPDCSRHHHRADRLCHLLGCIHLCAADHRPGVQADRTVRRKDHG